MKFTAAVDLYITDMRAEGRLRSAHSEAAYRAKLEAHAEDVDNRDPSKTGKADVKKTLLRWEYPNSRRQAHSVLRSFYRWCTQEDIRETNPADQVRETRRVEPQVFRPTRTEVVALLDASMGRPRDRWVVHLGVLAGARSQELRGFQGRHFARDGFVWVSPDIGKGGKGRWMPVLGELQPIVEEIRRLVPHDRFVLGTLVTVDPPSRHRETFNTEQVERNQTPISANGLYKLVGRVGERAGLPTRIGPHTLRHAFGDHVARYAGLRAAQELMGHSSVETTAGTYTDRPTLDELAVSVQGFRYRQLSTRETREIPHG